MTHDIHACPTCGRNRRPEHFICDTCTTINNDNLQLIDWLTEELTITASKQRGIDYRALGGSPSTETPIPYHGAAVAAQAALTHAGTLNYDPTNANVETNQQTLIDAISQATRLIDRPDDTWFAGPCGTDDCTADLYATTATGYVRCGSCDTTHDIEERRKWLLETARDRLADATTLARYISICAGKPLSADRVRQWGHRKRLPEKGHDKSGRPVYRIGDALDLLNPPNTNVA